MAGGSTRWRGRSVISKVASLLDAFTPSTPQLSLGELAQATGLPMSTTYRLALELVVWGALERADGGAGYRLGPRISELGALAPRRARLSAIALPFMEDLREATGCDVRLAVLEGLHSRYVEAVTAEPSRSAPQWHAGGLPLHATSAGKVLLAHAPEDLLGEVLAGDLRRFTPRTVTSSGELRRVLRDVRRSGVAYERDELVVGQQSVASPVVGASGSAVAALALVRFARPAGFVRLGPAVRTAAISMSRAWRVEAPLAVS